MDHRPPSTRRNSLRHPGYDYRQSSCLFVTICTHRRQRLFGSVVGGDMQLSAQGLWVERCLLDIPDRVAGVVVDAHVVMPDHVHAILLTNIDPRHDTSVAIADIVHDFKIRVRS